MLSDQEKQDIANEIKNHSHGISTYYEWCPHCEGETQYTVSDIGDDSQIECRCCHKRIAPCDFCSEYNNGCGTCSPNLEKVVKEARESLPS